MRLRWRLPAHSSVLGYQRHLMRPTFWISLLLVVVSLNHATAQEEERRIALVIGNADYEQGRLRNPVNDARAVAHVLGRAGFEVIIRENADRRAMHESIIAFGDRLKETRGVGLFYFSGHGLQVQGRNFMIPVGSRIVSERFVDTEAIDVNRVLGEMDAAQARINIVILDACRDNPYGRSFRSVQRGLAQIDAPRGTLIAYATAPGKLAEDGPGQNSPYSAALVKHLPIPGLPIEAVFKRVRIEVLERTANRQEPWEASSLTGDFLFFPLLAAAPPPAATGTPTIREEMNPESIVWTWDDPRIPGPPQLEIRRPRVALPGRGAAFSGAWAGAWDSILPSRLIIESVDSESAIVVYAWGDHPWRRFRGGWVRVRARISLEKSGSSLSWGSTPAFRFQLGKDGKTLEGQRQEGGTVSVIQMKKIAP